MLWCGLLRFAHQMLFCIALGTAALCVTGSASAQTDDELETVYQRVIAMFNAGKYAEAIPIAEQYASAVRARHGEDHSEYATALNNLAALLQATNRLADAEPL